MGRSAKSGGCESGCGGGCVVREIKKRGEREGERKKRRKKDTKFASSSRIVVVKDGVVLQDCSEYCITKWRREEVVF